ncbi:MAG: hypothetical protein KatS3mg132_724 [Limisphaera sp.]|nr:MAG: hypothetical protein KatS3mg132_724 [Limisphaera sp.]
MTSQPKPSRMRQALSVAEEKIWFVSQLLQGRQEHGGFTEREQSRDVGKTKPAVSGSTFHFPGLFQVPNDCGSDHPATVPAEGGIQARDPPGTPSHGGLAYPGGQMELELPGGRGGTWPGGRRGPVLQKARSGTPGLA